MTKPTDESMASNYLEKAENSLRMAKIALEQKAYDNAVMSAIHSAINVLDALAVSHLGKRASGTHTDSLLIVKPLFTTNEYLEISKQFTSLISKKNASEYQPELMSKGDAERSIKGAERIADRVKQKMKNLNQMK